MLLLPSVGMAQAALEATIPPPVEQETSATLEWNEEWTRFQWGHIALTTGAFALTLGTRVIGPRESAWGGRNGFDEGVRDAMRLPTEGARHTARDASDVLLSLVLAYPILIDGILVAAYAHESPDVGIQLILMSLETMLVTTGIWSLVSELVSRERPYGRECGEELSADSGACVENDRSLSFFSGHTALTFAAATSTCVNHSQLDLHEGFANHLPCVVGLGLAATTGALRILADRHYLTDVLTGAAAGTAIGLLVPFLLHYHSFSAPSSDDSLQLNLSVGPGGVQLVGAF